MPIRLQGYFHLEAHARIGAGIGARRHVYVSNVNAIFLRNAIFMRNAILRNAIFVKCFF